MRRVLPRRARIAPLAMVRLRGQRGIEIGGRSPMFERYGLLPAYAVAAQVDTFDIVAPIADDPVRQREVAVDRAHPPGSRLVCEPTALTPLADRSAGFVLASHVLEHIANPLKALREWQRVLAPEGTLLVVLPHKVGTFDHQRPTTPLSHMEDDLAADTGEDDLTHLDEILALHDLSRDRAAGTRDAFRSRSLRNRENRALHHHVFETRTAVELIDRAGYEILAVDTVAPMHIVVLACRPAPSSLFSNERFLAVNAEWVRLSVFSSDRLGTPDPVIRAPMPVGSDQRSLTTG